MIEIYVDSYLKDNLPVPVFTQKPSKDIPKRYVLIDRIGGSKENHLKSATIAFQSYAESKYEAAKLNEEVKKVVEQMIELDEIAGISLDNDYNFTDTTTKKYRYQAVYEIYHY